MRRDGSNLGDHERLRRYLRDHRRRTLTHMTIIVLMAVCLVALVVADARDDRPTLIVSTVCLGGLLAVGYHVSRDP